MLLAACVLTLGTGAAFAQRSMPPSQPTPDNQAPRGSWAGQQDRAAAGSGEGRALRPDRRRATTGSRPVPGGVAQGAYDGRGLGLTADQERAIYNATSGMHGIAPRGFVPWIGRTLPQSVEVHPLPSIVARMLMPSVRNHKVARLNDKAILVEPKRRTIVDIVTLPEQAIVR
jgi:hypothetical protein